jgi:DNA mismatch repair protein MutS
VRAAEEQMTPTENQTANLTPMMRQYFELKSKVPDAVVLFRMGDFYEIFGEDAELVAPKLQLVLTSREKGDNQRVPFCGVPHHSAKNYWIKLLRMGFKVAFVDQVEDPKDAKGLVRREVTKVLSPGCIDDPDGLIPEDPNYLAACYEDPKSRMWAVALVDVSTGEFRMGHCEASEQVVQLVRQYGSGQLLCRSVHQDWFKKALHDPSNERQILVDLLPELPLRTPRMRDELISSTFAAGHLGELPCGEITGGSELAAAVLHYLQASKLSTRQFQTIRALTEPDTMMIDPVAVRDLELLCSSRRGDANGSLYKEINRTLSPMGARQFRSLMLRPLISSSEIQSRQQTVAALLALGESGLQELRKLLHGTPDLARLMTKVIGQTATPVDLSQIRDSLRRAEQIIDFAQAKELTKHAFLSELTTSLINGRAAAELLARALLANPTQLGQGNGVFSDAFSPELARFNSTGSNSMQRVEAYEAELRQQTGINSLKIRHHKSFGLLIEVTKTNIAKIPKSFVRRQTMVNCERFMTSELEDLNSDVESAQQQAITLEAELYAGLLANLSTHQPELNTVSQALAWLDVMQSMAWKGLEARYCIPVTAADGCLHLKAARHPVVERFVGAHAFSPNDVILPSDRRHVLITGPNMAGKSTIMRQVALIAIMHQMGCMVPCLSAKIPVFDRIFTRVGAADDLSRGQSTFMVEMSEAASILRQCTAKSLVILDEVGRGTSTQDGLALATAIFEDLVQRANCYTLFATHYHELVSTAERLERVQLMQNEVKKVGEEVQFTHRFIPGSAASSYGVEVAKLAGVPAQVIKRALTLLAAQNIPSAAPTATTSAAPNSTAMLKLQVEPKGDNIDSDIIKRIRTININRTNPLNALLILSELREAIDHRVQGLLFENSEFQ